jgi:hypothetical protein
MGIASDVYAFRCLLGRVETEVAQNLDPGAPNVVDQIASALQDALGMNGRGRGGGSTLVAS